MRTRLIVGLCQLQTVDLIMLFSHLKDLDTVPIFLISAIVMYSRSDLFHNGIEIL